MESKEESRRIIQILHKWDSLLRGFGKIDILYVRNGISAIDRYLNTCENSSTIDALRMAKSYAMRKSPDMNLFQSVISDCIKSISSQLVEDVPPRLPARKSMSEMYQFATKKLYNEKIRFKGDKYLRNIDPTMEDGETNRMVRRIVEKRMCQAYYKTRKGFACKADRRDRVGEIRATSYQMQNIGQVESINGLTRTDRTHWKRTFDNVTGKFVLKPKDCYDTMAEAEAAARRKGENEKGGNLLSPYKCAYCGKYHIGHRTSSYIEEIEPASASRNIYDGQTFAG